jgi:DNA mismatch endonuclease (patch repair protein)
MMDTLTPEQRSVRMSRVRGQDTKPEMAVRRALHALGFRFRLHDKRLPGRPDLVFPGRGKVVFVHGCFWHRHEGCTLARLPKSRLEFWIPKLEANRARDAAKLAALSEAGWRATVIWECELKDMKRAAERLARFLTDKDGDEDASC